VAVKRGGSIHDQWAELRFAIVGPLLASPPARGELAGALDMLSHRTWIHAVTGEPVSFAAATIERWLHQARAAGVDRVGALKKRVRRDAGTHPSLSPELRSALVAQYEAHRSWSYLLHADNVRVVCEQDAALGECPSYTTLRRYMKESGLVRQRRVSRLDTPGTERARERLATSEVRSYEATHVNAL